MEKEDIYNDSLERITILDILKLWCYGYKIGINDGKVCDVSKEVKE